MSSPKLAVFLVIAVLLSLSSVHAQQAAPLARHPGDVIRYEIKFSGPNADKIKNISADLRIGTGIPKDQSGFAADVPMSSSSHTSADTFRIELTVPSNIATGDYDLVVSAAADEGNATYFNGQDFHVPHIHIENPKKFVPPSITVTPLP